MPQINPNGESSCAASYMAADKAYQTGGLIARVFTACPLEPGVTWG
jgi:hypothetical protein